MPEVGLAGSAASEPPDPVSAGLERLERAGARQLDAPGCEMIRGLLARAEALEGEAREQLVVRAAARYADLEARLVARREVAIAEMSRLKERGLDGGEVLEEALAAGDLERVMRAGRRARTREGRAHAAPRERPSTHYGNALADLSTALSLAAAEDSPVEQVGLLNGTQLAARLLKFAGELSPAYRRSLVSRLVDLAPLLELPPIPAPRKRG